MHNNDQVIGRLCVDNESDKIIRRSKYKHSETHSASRHAYWVEA